MSKRLIAGVAVAALVLGGFVGGVLLGSPNASSAQEDSTTTTVPDTAVVPQTPDWIQQALGGLVADGTITQAQADAVAEALASAKPFDRGPREGHFFGGDLSVVADAIGIDETALMTALQSGQSLAEIAVANGKTAQVVIDALVAEAKTHLDGEVTEGDLTQDEADARLADATTAITAMVNGEAPLGGRGFGGPGFDGPGHHGHGFGPGMMNPDDNTTDTAPAASDTSL